MKKIFFLLLVLCCSSLTAAETEFAEFREKARQVEPLSDADYKLGMELMEAMKKQGHLSADSFDCRLDSSEESFLILLKINVVVTDCDHVAYKDLEFFAHKLAFVDKSVIVTSAVADNYSSVNDFKLEMITRDVSFIQDEIVFRTSTDSYKITVELKNIQFVSVVFDYEFQNSH